MEYPELPGTPKQESSCHPLGDSLQDSGLRRPQNRKLSANRPAPPLSSETQHPRCSYGKGLVRGFAHRTATTGLCRGNPQPSGTDGNINTDGYNRIVSLFHRQPFCSEKGETDFRGLLLLPPLTTSTWGRARPS